MRRFRRTHGRDDILGSEKGIAAIEFALLAPLLCLLLMGIVNLGIAFNAKLKIISALAAGAQYIQRTGGSLTSSNFASFSTDVKSVVTSVLNLSATPTTTVLSNNTSDGSKASTYYCLSGSPPTWTATGTSSANCGSNVMSGQFVTLTISVTLSNVFPTNTFVGAVFPLTETIIVRVQ